MSKITLDNLSDNLKAYLEGLGLSEEQVLNLINENGLNEEELKAMLKDTMSINELSTNSKTVIGAINELFQSANNGKELIANAIGEPLNAEDTFNAMSDDINGLLSTFKTNMMNNGVTVESNDRFKSLIDKIATMVEEGSGKGIQFATGTIECTWTGYGGPSGGNDYLSPSFTFETPIEFSPTYFFINIPNLVCPDNNSQYQNVMVSNIHAIQNSSYEYDEVRIDNLTNEGFSFYLYGVGIQPLNGIYDYTWYAIGVGEEDTTLRDSLADILGDKGIEVTPEDDMANLITKVDSIKVSNFPDWYSTSNVWISAASAPAALSRHSSAVVDDCIYVMSKAKTYCYNTKNNQWTTKADIPGYYSSYTDHASIALNGIVYIFGYAWGSIMNTYDPVKDAWGTASYMSFNLGRQAIASVGNSIYMFGGRNDTGSEDRQSIVRCYDTISKTWTDKKSFVTGHENFPAVNINDKIYICGGRGYADSRILDTTYMFDPVANSWTQKTSMSVGKLEEHRAVAYNNQMIVTGGILNPTYFSHTLSYDSITDTWSTLTNMNSTRSVHSSEICNGKIYVFGGYNGAEMNSVECYLP